MAQPTTFVTERVTYRDGQRLMARDLRDDRAARARLRRLHLLNLHETWGIAEGFDVQAVGPSNVAVGPGYALDQVARDLVLSSSLAVPVPAVTGPTVFVLVATFIPDCSFPTTAAGTGACFSAPIDPRRERPALAWQEPSAFEPGPMVPLCSVVVQNNAMAGPIGTRVRRYARRLVRPFVATGQSDADASVWHEWWNRGILDGYYQLVDTSDAGFTATPQYFAQLVPIKPSASHSDLDILQALATSYGHVKQASRNGFVFQAVVPEPFRRDLLDTWAVSWIGVQPMAGCPPALNLKRLLTLAGRVFVLKP